MATLLTMLVTSVADSHSGLPVSSPMVRASSSLCALRVAANCSSTAMRSSSGRRAQAGKAARAAATACSTCAAVAPWPLHTASWVTGLSESKASPCPASHWPAM